MRATRTQLKAEHLEQLYRTMFEAGAAPGNAHQVHRTALGVAYRRGHVSHNVATPAKPPRVEVVEVVLC